MKKTTLALFLAAVAAMPVMAQDKSGFALTGGMVNYTGKLGDYLDENDGSKYVFQLGADYTFSQGVILGVSSTAPNKLDDDNDLSAATLFAGYELDCGVRLKAGLGYSFIQADRRTDHESGLMLGLGYAFDNGIIVEGAYTDIDGEKAKYGFTAISVGYKF